MKTLVIRKDLDSAQTLLNGFFKIMTMVILFDGYQKVCKSPSGVGIISYCTLIIPCSLSLIPNNQFIKACSCLCPIEWRKNNWLQWDATQNQVQTKLGLKIFKFMLLFIFNEISFLHIFTKQTTWLSKNLSSSLGCVISVGTSRVLRNFTLNLPDVSRG